MCSTGRTKKKRVDCDLISSAAKAVKCVNGQKMLIARPKFDVHTPIVWIHKKWNYAEQVKNVRIIWFATARIPFDASNF